MNRMYWNQRNREVIFYETVLRNHPDYAGSPIWYDHNSEWHIEGGDILNINAKTLAIGISERTQTAAIDELAKNMFWGSDEAEMRTSMPSRFRTAMLHASRHRLHAGRS